MFYYILIRFEWAIPTFVVVPEKNASNKIRQRKKFNSESKKMNSQKILMLTERPFKVS